MTATISKAPARAMIMAAGFGTRLEALGRHWPKPMLPVCGAPLIRWALYWLKTQGVCEVVINLHHRGEVIESALGDGRDFGMSIQYSREEEILGTGGGLLRARSLLDPGDGLPVVALNGKLIHDISLEKLLEAHRRHGAEATMTMRKDLEGIWGSRLRYDPQREGLSTFLDEDSPLADPAHEPVMFCGVHVMQPKFFDRIPTTGSPCVARSAYRDLFRNEGLISAMLHEGYWWEHSTPERYAQGVAKVLGGAIGESYCPNPPGYRSPKAKIEEGAKIDAMTWIGDEVRIEAGAEVGPGTQILAGAEILGSARLRQCVVMPNAKVSGVFDAGVVGLQE